jgi:peptide deformylase
MAILKVAQLGNPILRQKSSEVPLDHLQSDAFQRLLEDMVETMREYGGVGLAAPQIHQNLRVFVMEVAANPRYPDRDAFPLTFVVNPRVTSHQDATEDAWEGCLSVPGIRGKVPRLERIELEAQERNGELFRRSLQGFPARVVQHEVDHLDGLIFIDRMKDLPSLSFEAEYQRFHV